MVSPFSVVLNKYVGEKIKDRILNAKKISNNLSTMSNNIATNTEIYVKVFPQSKGDEESSLIKANDLVNITNIVVSQGKKTTNVIKDISDDLTAACIACSIDKSIGEVGTWNITVKQTDYWYKHLSTGDWVAIYLGDNIQGNASESIRMIGMIDTIRETSVIQNNGQKTRMWQIAGRDFGRVFEDTSVYVSNVTGTQAGIEKLQQQLIPDDTIKSPDTYIKKFIEVVLKGRGESVTRMKIPRSLSSFLGGFSNIYTDIINFDINDTIGHAVKLQTLPDDGYSTLMDMMQTSTNAPWNEFIFDIVDGLPTFIFQPTILNNTDDMFSLANKTAIEIPSTLITKRNIGLSDHERVNFVNLHGFSGLDKDRESLLIAARGVPYVPRSIEKYGLKKREISTEFVQPILPQGVATKINNIDDTIFSQLRDILATYLFDKHKLLNGTLTLETDTFIPNLGRWIKIDKDILLKVEGVSLEWEFGESMTVDIAVSHGMSSEGSTPFVEQNVQGIDAVIGSQKLDYRNNNDSIHKTNKNIKQPKSSALDSIKDVPVSIADIGKIT